MKKTTWARVTTALFCGFLGIMALGYLFLPKTDFSQQEKRYLAETPKLSWRALSSGKWGTEVEGYLADHIPGRNFFVGLNAYFDLVTGRQSGKDIRVLGDRLVEAPVRENGAAIEKNMSFVSGFAGKLGRTVDLMIVPSAGWAGAGKGYQDEKILKAIEDQAGENLNFVDLTQAFAGKPELYFKTDHHWNSVGAYRGYAAYMGEKGREVRDESDFQKEVQAGFQGSTYSRSALWLTPAEDLELWTGSETLTASNAETEGEHPGVFYRERLAETDKYTVYLDGNHSLVRVKNPEKTGKLLVIRDSYSNLLGCFLAESYGEVVLADLRYYRKPLSELVEQEGFDDVLVCYSIGNFLTDTNLIWLK